MNCEAVQGGNLAERYVLGQLSEPEQSSFEEHYYVCDRCLDEVRLLQALQSAVPQTLPAVRKQVPRAVVWGAIAATLVMALGLASIPWLRHQPAKPVATANTASLAQAADEYSAALRLLARAEPPRYSPSKLRSGTAAPDDWFPDAMDRYAHGDYAGAAQGLRGHAMASPDAAAPLFYLGVSDLATGRVDDAVTELRRAEAMGDTPYLEPARFYLAKALLAKEDATGAARMLELTIQLAGDREAEARQLLAQLRGLSAPR